MTTIRDDLFSTYAFQDGDPVYLFTNENIHGTLKTAGDISGKKILTVGASGDHVFESYLLGAGDVHTFDINSNQKNVIELKNHMIRGLPYANFMDFFFDKKNFFNQKILISIKSNFSDDLRTFLKKCNGLDKRKNFKYRAAYTSEYNIKRLQYIANENNYNIVRDRLPERIPFKHCDIAKSVYSITEKYDLILLSNIFSYLYAYSRDTAQRLHYMHSNVLAPLIVNNTTNDGRVYFHYAWGERTEAWVNFLHYFQTQNALPSKLVARTVDGAYHNYEFDTVLYATRNQR